MFANKCLNMNKSLQTVSNFSFIVILIACEVIPGISWRVEDWVQPPPKNSLLLWSRPTPPPRPGRGKRVLLRTSARLTGRDLEQSQRGNSLKNLWQPPALLGKKSSGVSSATPEDTTSPAVMLRITYPDSTLKCEFMTWWLR